MFLVVGRKKDILQVSHLFQSQNCYVFIPACMLCDCDRFETFIVGDLVIFFKVTILYVGLGGILLNQRMDF